jgi:hypothetical protein
MITGYDRVSTTEQNLGLKHDDLKPAFDASVDPTEARSGEVVNEKNAPNTDALRFGLSSLNDRTH